MSRTLGIPTTDCNYFDYLRIAKSQSRGKALQRLQRRLEEPLMQTTTLFQEALEEQHRGSVEIFLISIFTVCVLTLPYRIAVLRIRYCAAKALFSCPAIISQRLEPRIISNEPLENTEEESKII
jgi:anaerobic C4-dicarboxylate transporter